MVFERTLWAWVAIFSGSTPSEGRLLRGPWSPLARPPAAVQLGGVVLADRTGFKLASHSAKVAVRSPEEDRGTWTQYEAKDWSYINSLEDNLSRASNSGESLNTLSGAAEKTKILPATAGTTSEWNLYSAMDWTAHPAAMQAWTLPPAATAQYTLPPAARMQYTLPPEAILAYTLPPEASTAYTPPPEAMVAYTAPPEAATAYTAPPEAMVAYTAPPEANIAYTAPPEAMAAYTAPPEAMAAYTAPPEAMAAYTAPPEAMAAYTAPPEAMAAYTAPPEAMATYTAPPEAMATYTAPPEAMVAYTAPPDPALLDYSKGDWNQYSQKDWSDIPDMYKKPEDSAYQPAQATGNFVTSEQKWYAPADPIKDYIADQDGADWTQYRDKDWAVGDDTNGDYKKYEDFGQWAGMYGPEGSEPVMWQNTNWQEHMLDEWAAKGQSAR